jgi:two-component system sensor histidine kinase ChiS
MMAVMAGAGAVLVFVADRRPADAPRAASGRVDLMSWNFARSGPVSLSGDWNFYPGAFVEPDPAGNSAAPTSVKVPGDWRGSSSGGPAMASAYGYGSYALSVRRPPGQPGLALLMPDESISWRLFVDGRLRAANGLPARSAEAAIVRRESILVPLRDIAENEGPTQIVIQVSNFTYDVGGLINPILIGPAHALAVRIEAMSALNGFFLGGLFVMALFQFYLFIFRIGDKSSLYFSLFCFLCLLRSFAIAHYPERLFAGGPLEMEIFKLSTRVEYLAFYLGLPVYLAFVLDLFPAESDRRVFKVSLAIGIAFSAVVIAAPLPFFMAWTTKPYQALTLVGALYALLVFAKAAARKRTGALYGLFGFAVFLLVIINDILHANLVIRTAHLSPLGLMIFMITHSFIVSSRIATTFAHEKQLARELSEEKSLLDRRIAERTAELTASNQRLRNMDKAKSRFLATISHELRTPITLIVSPVEQVVRGKYGPSVPKDGEIFARLLRNGYRMLNIIEGMFDFARLELGRLSPRLERVDLAKTLAFYASEFESLARKKGISLAFEDSLESPCGVHIDPRLFEIAFFNVVSNALKFTPRGGSVLIGAAGPGPDGRTAVAIRDSGIGIAPELLPRIFSKLDWQADESDRLYDGAGIGLSLSKKIVELHGGEIRVHSESGVGSTFTILLPASFEAADRGCEGSTAPSEIGNRGKSILGESLGESPADPAESAVGEEGASLLLVEDNRELLQFMWERLAARFRVHCACDGEEALRVLRQGLRADLVVTDVMMPKMDGNLLFREARGLLGDRCPPFVFLTARNDGEERREALAEGAVDYLAKPFDMDELALKIESLLAMCARDRDGAKRDVKEALARFLDNEAEPGQGGSGQARTPQESHRAGAKRRAELLARLSPRESEIAIRAARGMQDKEIATELKLATRTVSNTLLRIYRKIGVGNRLELIRLLGEEE